jgi:formate hydrogenlyase subunit 6/NADH:ubiquinone oxidoreductase subunit I
MGYIKDISDGLLTAAKGMRITLAHLRERPNTVQWPHDPATTKPLTRGQLHNDIEDCGGCMKCSQACPVDCITIETVKSIKSVNLGSSSNGQKKTMHMARFDIDMAKCCYCGLCADVCGTGSLTMTETFEYSQAEVGSLSYSFASMTPEEVEAAREALAAEKKEVAAARAAKAKAEKAKKASEAAAEAAAGDEGAQAQEI